MRKAFQLKQFFNILGIAILVAGVFIVYVPSNDKDAAVKSPKGLIFVWLIVAYALVALFVFLVELYTSRADSTKSTYKDVSLVFSGSALKSEKEIADAVNQLSGNKVLEVSLVYDLGKYFELKNEAKILASKNKEETPELKKLNGEIDQIKSTFDRNKSKFSLGKGFITFKNFLAAKQFKDLHKEAYSELAAKSDATKKIPSGLDVKASVTDELKNAKKHLDSGVSPIRRVDNEISSKIQENDASAPFRRAETYLPAKARFQANIADDSSPTKPIPKVAETLTEKAEKKKQIVALFGPDFKIERGVDPETLNFKFVASNQMTRNDAIKYAAVVFGLLPFVAYIFNYYYYFLDIGLFVGSFSGVAAKAAKYISLIATVLVDQVAFAYIDKTLTKNRFFNQSQMYGYIVASYSIYTLLSTLIAPNFAMKFAFLDFSEKISVHDRAATIRYLIESAFVVYYILIFGGVNYKVIKPLLAGKFKSGRLEEATAHGQILFNVSFIVSSVFYASFYGSITPLIFVIYGVVLSLNYLYDTYVYKMIEYAKKADSKKKDDDVDFDGVKEEVPVLPVTVFSSAAWSLCAGIFFLTMLGYYGLTLDINNFFTEANAHKLVHKEHLSDVGKIVGSAASGFALDVSSSLSHILKVSVRNSGFFLRKLFTRGIYHIVTDWYLLFGVAIWGIVFYFFQKFHSNERLLNRIQSRIWQGKEKVEELVFEGKSFREINPAYAEMK